MTCVGGRRVVSKGAHSGNENGEAWRGEKGRMENS